MPAMAWDVGILAAKARLAPATRALLMNAYLNFMDSVMRFWMNWMDLVTRFGANAVTEALIPSRNALIRASASSDQQADVGKASSLFDLHGLYQGSRWDHIYSAPEHVVINTNFYFGDVARVAERRPGSIAERHCSGDTNCS